MDQGPFEQNYNPVLLDLSGVRHILSTLIESRESIVNSPYYSVHESDPFTEFTLSLLDSLLHVLREVLRLLS